MELRAGETLAGYHRRIRRPHAEPRQDAGRLIEVLTLIGDPLAFLHQGVVR